MSGCSSRICSSVMPAPSQPGTSHTVMRRPRMQGLPPRLPGSMVILLLTADLRCPLLSMPSAASLCILESCLIQDEPGEGGGFSYKMSLEERSRMLGLDHQRAHIGTLEPGAHSGLFRRQWRGRIQGTESGGGLRLGESDATAATV